MPRDSSGSFSLPAGTIVAAGDDLLPSQHNPAFLDVAQAIGNSLSRDGSGGMRSPLDMGGYPIRNVASGTSATDVATRADVASTGVPVGSLLAFAGATAPTGYLLCDGRVISRTTYAALFAVIGTSYGPGDGSTTFKVPDTRGNAIVGQDNMGGTAAGRLNGANAVGTQLGAQSVTLTENQIPAHTHDVNDPGHQHGYISYQSVGGSGLQSGTGSPETAPRTTAFSGTGITIQSTGGSQPHTNVQPSLVANYIIKAIP